MFDLVNSVDHAPRRNRESVASFNLNVSHPSAISSYWRRQYRYKAGTKLNK